LVIYKSYTKIYGQQNIKQRRNLLYVHRNGVGALKRTDHLEDGGVYYNIIYFSVPQQPNSGLPALLLRFPDHTQLDTRTRTHTHTHPVALL